MPFDVYDIGLMQRLTKEHKCNSQIAQFAVHFWSRLMQQRTKKCASQSAQAAVQNVQVKLVNLNPLARPIE